MKALKRSGVGVLLLAAAAFAGQPEFVTKEATGEAAIVDGNEARAEKEAKDAAIREMVEQVAGVLVSAETLTQNSQLIRDRIYAQSSGYARNARVLSKRVEKGVMFVTVKAEVSAAKIDRDLAAVRQLINEHGNRRLVILTQEHAIDSKGVVTSSGVMGTELTNAFKNDGWTILDPNFAAGKLKLAPGASLGAAEAKEIGELTKADYILYGTVNFRYQAPVTGGIAPEVDAKGNQIMFNVTGEYDLAMFATDSGDQLTKVAGKFNTGDGLKKGGSNMVSYERTAHDIAKAHGPKVVSDVRGPVLEHLRSARQNGSRVVMSVTGLPDYAAVQAFKQSIGRLNNVKEVKPGTFSGGKAQFDVTFLGTTDDLAGALANAKFKKKKLTVTGVTANTVEVVVAR